MSLIVVAFSYWADSESSRSRLADSPGDAPYLVLLVASLSVQTPNANSIDSKSLVVVTNIAGSLDNEAEVTPRYSFHFKDSWVPMTPTS